MEHLSGYENQRYIFLNCAVGEAQDEDELFDRGLSSLQEADDITQVLNKLLESMAVDRRRRESNEDEVMHEELIGNHRTTLSGYSREKEQKKGVDSNFAVKKNSVGGDSVVQAVDERSLPKLPTVVAMETLQPAVQGEDISTTLQA